MAIFPLVLTFVLWSLYESKLTKLTLRLTRADRITNPTSASVAFELIRDFNIVLILWVAHFICGQAFGFGEFLVDWEILLLVGFVVEDRDEDDQSAADDDNADKEGEGEDDDDDDDDDDSNDGNRDGDDVTGSGGGAKNRISQFDGDRRIDADLLKHSSLN